VTQEINKPTQRRHGSVNRAMPEQVISLSDTHSAILQQIPMFPSTVVTAGNGTRVLVSGVNNRKIGRVVTKGALKGYAIYTVTLAERTTCPSHCLQYKTCYGNAMHLAIRHRPGAELEQSIERELRGLMQDHPKGVLVRLHTLGDFYSVEYVEFWSRMLEHFPRLALYGYTAHNLSTDESRDIAMAIARAMNVSEGRMMIRLSGQPGPMGALVIERKPEQAKVAEGIVCPAERDATSCCATCGLCWAPEASDETIVFVRHGMGSRKGDAMRETLAAVDEKRVRPIRAVAELVGIATTPESAPPRMLWVKPSDLLVDETYQRTLSRSSIKLITKIVRGFSWSKFKPPITCETPEGLYVIDGQHTAIGAATHPDIDQIPVMVVEASSMTDRAKAFLGHNRDRIALSAGQIHVSAAQAGDPEAVEINRLCAEAGVSILAVPPVNNRFLPGQTMALGAIRSLLRGHGPWMVTTVLKTLIRAEMIPIRADQIKALAEAIDTSDTVSDAVVFWSNVLRFRTFDEFVDVARPSAAASGEPLWRGLARTYMLASRELMAMAEVDLDGRLAPAATMETASEAV
jgi:hypothetical protein